MLALPDNHAAREYLLTRALMASEFSGLIASREQSASS
jgi:hypothetical protein